MNFVSFSSAMACYSTFDFLKIFLKNISEKVKFLSPTEVCVGSELARRPSPAHLEIRGHFVTLTVAFFASK